MTVYIVVMLFQGVLDEIIAFSNKANAVDQYICFWEAAGYSGEFDACATEEDAFHKAKEIEDEDYEIHFFTTDL